MRTLLALLALPWRYYIENVYVTRYRLLYPQALPLLLPGNVPRLADATARAQNGTSPLLASSSVVGIGGGRVERMAKEMNEPLIVSLIFF